MLRIPGMPLLPGTLFRDISKSNYPKPQSLMNYQGLGMLNDRQHPPLVDPNGAVVDISCPPVAAASIYPPRTGPRMPPWLAYDKKVLRFSAYFKQTLQEVYHAPYIVRHVKIYYFLEDGTLEISEPKVENSGIVQGCVVHRQRVPKAPPCEHEFMNMIDLNVDMTVQIFDRKYHIIDCDQFTRDFLNRRGISVPDPVPPPVDPLESTRARSNAKASQPREQKHPFAQFLKYDRQILRFQGYWDDRTEFGDVRKLEICYYLADDTVEVKEAHVRNSGRDGPTVFLKRGRLPREFNGMQLPGQQTPVTLLNVLGTNMRNFRYCEDPLNTGYKEIYYYNERDFQIGTVMNIYGRAVVITDLDPYTQQYYRERFGIDDFTPLPVPTRSEDCAEYNPSERVLPPYNGWGTYEDSVGNCISVEPKPPHKDFKKFIQYDRYVLRFGAKMLSTIKENCDRIFIISYYLSDDTMQIMEIAVRNSGFLGGEFMKRIRLEVPGQEKFSCKQPLYYMPWHFYIGSTMVLKDFIFHIVSADEYTLMYMEHHPDQFPHANIKIIMEKVRNAVQGRLEEFVGACVPDCSDVDARDLFVSHESFKGALIGIMGNKISDHEIISLCRHFSAEQAPPHACRRENVRAAAHLEIKRALWNARDDLMEHFHHINPTNRPFLPESKVRSTLRGCRLPFTLELIDNILSILNRNECDEIEVCDLMNFIDVSCGKGCDMPPVNLAFELCPKIPFLSKGRTVNFACFLRNLGMSVKLVDGQEKPNANIGDGMIKPPTAIIAPHAQPQQQQPHIHFELQPGEGREPGDDDLMKAITME